MTSKRLRDFAPSLLLLAGCAVLALVLLAEWVTFRYRYADLQASREQAELPADFDEGQAGDIRLKDSEEYTDMVERPLFQDGRRPAEPDDVAASGTAEQTPLNFKLTGVIITPKEKSALFLDAQNKHKRARLNGSVSGWKLAEILPDRVVMEQAGERKELLLLKPKPKSAPPPVKTGRAVVRGPGQQPMRQNEDGEVPPEDADETDEDSVDTETESDETSDTEE